MTKTLRDYQSEAVEVTFNCLNNQDSKPIIVLPTGMGKSLVLADLIKQIHIKAPRTKIVLLTDKKRLLQQNAEELIQYYNNADFGFYCAGLNKKHLHNDIVLASIQSICGKANLFQKCPQILLIDECHGVSHNKNTRYRTFINNLLSINPKLRVIGLTATPFRSDYGRLCEGSGALFNEISYEADIKFGIDNGYLCRPRVPKIKYTIEVDESIVKSNKNDYIESQLQEYIDTDDINQSCVTEMIDVANKENRNKWLIFTAGIEHCKNVRNTLRENGISAEVVTSETGEIERDNILDNYERGDFTALVNVGVLTTGFNCPDIDMLVFMRPTKSIVLYVQMIGRGLRTIIDQFNTIKERLNAIANSNKKDCLVLDFGNVVKNLGPIDKVDIKGYGYVEPKEKEEEQEVGEAIMKKCPECGTECAATQDYCFNCSYCFISLDKNSEKEKAILSEDEIEHEYEVIGMLLSEHVKRKAPEDAPRTLRVQYITMVDNYSEYVCFEHSGYARNKAEKWHRDRLPDVLIPNTALEATKLNYPMPAKVVVKRDGKYDRIVKCKFDIEPVDVNELEELLLDEIPF